MHPLAVVAAFAVGAGIGLAFFAGLRATVARLPRARHPAALALASLLLRMGLAFGALYLLARSGGPVSLLAALAGFLVARVVLLATSWPDPPRRGRGGGS